MSVVNLSGNAVTPKTLLNATITNPVAYDGTSLVDATEIILMSYNCGAYYMGTGTNVPTAKESAYEAILRNIITENEADIMCIQEHWHQFSSGKTSTSIIDDYYTHLYENGESTTYGGRCTATNETVKSNSAWAFTNASVQGNCMDTVVTVDGKDIHILSVHLDWQDQSRQESQVAELLTWASDKTYFVICGDFNTDCLTVSDTDYVNVIKPFIDAGYHSANCSTDGFIKTYYDIDTKLPKYPCDQIICSSNITIADVWVDDSKVTDVPASDNIDHLPICAKLVIS